MKATSILFSVTALILACSLAACDGKTPKAGTPSDTPNAAAVQEKTEKAVDKTGQVLGDSAITAKAKLALAGTPDLKSMEISVETVQGRVTLSGNVASEAESQRAASIVGSVEGVKSVDNHLAVKSSV